MYPEKAGGRNHIDDFSLSFQIELEDDRKTCCHVHEVYPPRDGEFPLLHMRFRKLSLRVHPVVEGTDRRPDDPAPPAPAADIHAGHGGHQRGDEEHVAPHPRVPQKGYTLVDALPHHLARSQEPISVRRQGLEHHHHLENDQDEPVDLREHFFPRLWLTLSRLTKRPLN